MNKPYKQKVSVSLDEDIIAEIKELAENDDRSFSQYINLVLKEHIAKIKDREEQGSYQSVLHLEDALFFSVGIFLIKKKIILKQGITQKSRKNSAFLLFFEYNP